MLCVIDDKEVMVDVTDLIVAGWTGRDPAAVQHHIDELAALGVPAPSTVPLFYRVANGLLTQAPVIDVVGPDTSGEVEPFLVRLGGDLFLGLASDHTDRALETTSVAAAKQACAKPVAPTLWPFAPLEPHLDQLMLGCEIWEGDAWVTYQEGTLASILPLAMLVERAGLADGQAMLCGTLGAIGGVRPATAYRMHMTDPVLGRGITFSYDVRPLPVVA